MSAFTFATTFSGGGVADAGFLAAGGKPVLAVEWNAKPEVGPPDVIANIYADNYGDKHLLNLPIERITDRIWKSIEGVDLLHGSPPCPSFSVANSDGEETPEDIACAEAFCRAVRLARPKAVTLENVYGYRNSQSYRRITETLDDLGYRYCAEHINAADFGVPQSRKRLILRAVRTGCLPPLIPTHAEPGAIAQGTRSLFDAPLLPWNGWYDAIADLLPLCPESKLAAWQLKRLPEWVTTLLVGAGGFDGEIVRAEPQEPCFTVTANRNQSNQLRAVLVGDQRANNGVGALLRDGENPALTVDTRRAAKIRAVLVAGDNAGSNGGIASALWRDAITQTASMHKGMPRAILCRVAGENSEFAVEMGRDTPSVVSVHSSGKYRAVTDSPAVRVVALIPRCLARFQSLPDTYRLPEKKSLASTLIGNGLPSLLAQRIAESLYGGAE